MDKLLDDIGDILKKMADSSQTPVPDWNENIKVTIVDKFLAATFLKLIPEKVTPNQLTGFRFLSIPFVLYCFLTGHYLIGTILFAFSAFSDAIDGALARTRKQITEWGIVNDPIADKLLIGTVAVVVIAKFMAVWLATLIIFLELCLIMLNYRRFKGKVVQAKLAGKTKMVLQCLGVISLLLYVLTKVPAFFLVSEILLGFAVFFALVSLFVYYSI